MSITYSGWKRFGATKLDGLNCNRVDVLYLDNHLLVVNKEAGQPVQEDSSLDPDLLNEAKRFIGKKFNKPGNVFVGLVHRLDRPVSGVVVLARTSKAASRLSEQFRSRTIGKEYLALVEGQVTESGSIASYLRKDKSRIKVVARQAKGARRAELRYEPVTVVGRRTLLKVFPVTGRRHQIRVQLSNIGFPIVGDLKYRAKDEFDGRNLALHCFRMTVSHPVRNERMTWTAPLPPTWPTEIVRLIHDDS